MSVLPAAAPCRSCPYRLDVPSGVWAEEEYERLPKYDRETWDQPTSVFFCHQQDGRVCAGWAGTHDMDECLGFRLAVARGMILPGEADLIAAYESPVPLFPSGAAAAAHGLAELQTPGSSARRMIQRLSRKLRV